jgi:hypothetical protein
MNFFLLLISFASLTGLAAESDATPTDNADLEDRTLVGSEATFSLPKAVVNPELFTDETQKPNPLWFRSVGEWLSYRSVRPGLSTEPTSKILTDGGRFDTTIGKRIPIYSCGTGLTKGFVFGGDAGMLASLRRLKSSGAGVFATETFDGFFGLFTGYTNQGYLAILRWGHLSAHLVDDHPSVASAINYSHFWGELLLGKTWPDVNKPSNWNLHIQGSVGLNYMSAPPQDNPRYKGGVDLGYSPWGPDALAFLTSGDLEHAGVLGQSQNYAAFAGIGFLGRPESTHRPMRVGVTKVWGADHRNQFYNTTNSFVGAEIQVEL